MIYNGGMSARMSNLAPQQQGATLQGPSTPSLGTPSSEELGSHVLGFSANRPSEGFVLQYPTSTKAEIVNILRYQSFHFINFCHQELIIFCIHHL